MHSNELNEHQRLAVEHTQGALLVVAGAGSGKTRVITTKMAHLIIKKECDVRSIVALTFTNKAANEMKERLISLLGKNSSLPYVGTFHSYCLYLLKKQSKRLAFPHFSILDEDDTITLIRKIIKKNNLEKAISPAHARSYISSSKNSMNSEHLTSLYSNKLLSELFNAYEREKEQAHSFDFDDLLLEVVKLFKSESDFQKTFQTSVRHILVDEYQDTNAVQHELLKYMALSGKNLAIDSLCAVGDEDQSIYSWRGAVVANMLTFKNDFAPVTTVKIEQNFRSVQPILQASNAVISNNNERNEKELWSSRKATNRIVILRARSEYHEAESLITLIRCYTSTHSSHSIGLLYRTHMQSRVLEEAFIHANIPYKIIGSIQFYARKEVKDLLAYLKLVLNPHDRVSFFRVINTPTRGMGEKAEALFASFWASKPHLTFTEMIGTLLEKEEAEFTTKKKESLTEFVALFEGLTAHDKPSVVLDHILTGTDYVSYLKASLDKEEATIKVGIVKELLQAALYFEQIDSATHEEKEKTLESFLLNIALMQDKLEEQSATSNPIMLMTLHAAKGLEFDLVILPGLEEGIFPGHNALSSHSLLEEERRLLYVGMTRAKERLVISYARRRTTFGQTNHQEQSRFVREIPQELITYTDLDKLSSTMFETYCAQWLGSLRVPPQRFFGTASLSKLTTHATPAPLQAPIAPEKKRPARSTSWEINRPVLHKTFGIGVIKKIEKKDATIYLVILFKSGEKKLLSTFVSLL